jgi:hypothetical protein
VDTARKYPNLIVGFKTGHYGGTRPHGSRQAHRGTALIDVDETTETTGKARSIRRHAIQGD